MRADLIMTMLLFAGAGAASLEWNTARPGGVYVSLPARSPEACARACADDSICMAWTHVGETCELKAVTPAPAPYYGAVSGLSARAPAFAPRVGAPAIPPLRGESAPDPYVGPPAPARGDDSDLLGGPLAQDGDEAGEARAGGRR